MKYTIYTDNIELTPADQQQLEKSLQSLKKHLKPPYLIEVRLHHDRHHRKGEVVTCNLHIQADLSDKSFHAERQAETLATACDTAIEAIEHELAKAHDKAKKIDRGYKI